MKLPHGLARFLNWVEGEDTVPECALPRKKTSKNAKRTKRNRRKPSYFHVKKKAARLYRVMAVCVCLTVIGVLLLTVSWLPKFGNSTNPEENEVYDRYVGSGLEEAGAVNTVADMILDYRAFDTLGESNVLFIAVCSVIILLRGDRKKENRKEYYIPELATKTEEKNEDLVLRGTASVIVPIAVLFGIYVILNGHLSAGGGFSGGAILGGGMILYLLAFGFQKAERFFNEKTFRIVVCSALTFYCLAKSYSFFTGANGIESMIPLGTPGAIISSGLILPLNICVGLIVAFTMYSFYVMFRKGNF